MDLAQLYAKGFCQTMMLVMSETLVGYCSWQKKVYFRILQLYSTLSKMSDFSVIKDNCILNKRNTAISIRTSLVVLKFIMDINEWYAAIWVWQQWEKRFSWQLFGYALQTNWLDTSKTSVPVSNMVINISAERTSLTERL